MFTVKGLACFLVIRNITCIKRHTLHLPVRRCRVDALLLKKKQRRLIYGYDNFIICICRSGLGGLLTNGGNCRFIRAS